MNIKSALTVLAEIEGGDFVSDISTELNLAVSSVAQYQAKAKVIIELTITPSSKQKLNDAFVLIAGKVRSTLPEPVTPTIFQVDQDGNPTRQFNRNQEDLNFGLISTRKET